MDMTRPTYELVSESLLVFPPTERKDPELSSTPLNKHH